MAHPPFEPTKEQRGMVIALSGYYSQMQIAKLILDPGTELPINVKTLRKHFAVELKEGKDGANARVRASIFLMATEGKDIRAAALWAKTQMGWRETDEVLVGSSYGQLVEDAMAKARAAKEAALQAPRVIEGEAQVVPLPQLEHKEG